MGFDDTLEKRFDKIMKKIDTNTEKNFKTKVLKYLKNNFDGAWIYHPSDKWRTGIPDILMLWQGNFLAIELKVGDNKTSKLQDKTLSEIQNAGGYTIIAYHFDTLKIELNKYQKECEKNSIQVLQNIIR